MVRGRNHVDRNVPRQWIMFESIEDREARAIRQPDIEHDRARSVALRHGETVFGRGREQALEFELVGEIVEDPRERGIVLDNEKGARRRCKPVAIVRRRCGKTNTRASKRAWCAPRTRSCGGWRWC